MNIEKLENTLEAILFASGNPLEISALADALGMQKSEVKKAISALEKKYCDTCGIRLIEFNKKVQLATNPDYAEAVATMLNPIREKELTNSALETVAIIAYQQPVTRLEIEVIRGVNCDYAIQVLLKHGLIEAVGRKEVIGKPILFGTTEAFLKRFQVKSLDELPNYDQLLESIKVLAEKRQGDIQPEDTSLYNEFEIPEQEDSEG
ncbi:MAG: SMC-Scp complex subunit ScpB [Firmicutes bacterium]|nr:SMC-Scp complex subunit ScpB [Bacillota bacterium]